MDNVVSKVTDCGVDAKGQPLNGMAAVSQLLPGGKLFSHVWKNCNKLKTLPISET
jgi:hypothetical protein